VKGDRIDYSALAEDSSEFNAYLGQLNSVARSDVDAWSSEQQLAFWINAYNAFTVRAILDHYPITSWTIKGLVAPRNSIIQIPGVWKKLEWKVAGQSLTLDHIEHGLLRPLFKEPRIHFAIVCASIGCPDLRPEAFTFDKLDAQLEEQTKSYLSNSEKGVLLEPQKNRICVTQLFKWFNEDFAVGPANGLQIPERDKKELVALRFISHYLSEPGQVELLQSESLDFDYLPYDWSLNDIPHSHEPAS
jgi:hypothetical protein